MNRTPETEILVCCEGCGDVHPEFEQVEKAVEPAGLLHCWTAYCCPICHSPNYHVANLKEYTACVNALSGGPLTEQQYNALPYAWCVNYSPIQFLAQ